METKDVFKIGDRVYHWFRGWGEVVGEVQYNTGLFEKGSVLVEFDDGRRSKLSIFSLSFTEYDLVSGGLTHERPPGLKEGMSYVSEDGVCLVLDFNKNGCNYGFVDGMWRSAIIVNEDEGQWDEVHGDVIESILIEEAVRRFGGDWESVKIKKCMLNGQNYAYLNKGLNIAEVAKRTGKWEVWGENGCIFYKGKWAEPLEEEFEPFQKVLVRDFDDNKWRIDFFSNVDDELGFECMTDYWNQCIPFTGNKHLLNTKKNI